MKSKYKENRNKLYYLHQKIRKQGYVLDSSTKTISLPYNDEQLTEQVKKLRDDYGYNLQLTIN